MRLGRLGAVLAVGVLAAAAGCKVIAAVRRGGESPNTAAASLARDSRQTAERFEAMNRRCRAEADALVSFEDERVLGALSLLERASQGRGFLVDAEDCASCPRTQLLRELNLVGKAVALASSRPTLPWTFVVLIDERPFVFPAGGGFVGVSTGALATVRDESQLAGLLAHGIARVAEREPLERWLRRKSTLCLHAQSAAAFQAATLRALSGSPNKLHGAFGSFDAGAASAEAVETLIKPLLDEADEASEPAQALAAERTTAELLTFSGYQPTAYAELLESWVVQDVGGVRSASALPQRAAAVREATAGLEAFLSHARRPAVPRALGAALETARP